MCKSRFARAVIELAELPARRRTRLAHRVRRLLVGCVVDLLVVAVALAVARAHCCVLVEGQVPHNRFVNQAVGSRQCKGLQRADLV